MAGRQIYNPEGFKNIEKDGSLTGFEFQFKAQYYRGITLSIVRDIKVNIDGEDIERENVRFTVNGETFTLEEMRTVIDSDYRWEFGDYATVSGMETITLKQYRLLTLLTCHSRLKRYVRQIL